jgi:type I restriction enzyme, S subunit
MQLLKHFHELTLHPANEKQLKALILQLAVQGKLTAEWRKANPGVEPVEKLLERVKTEKERLIREKKIKPKRGDLVTKLNDKLKSLPKNWQWVKIADISNIFNGNSINQSEKEINFFGIKEGYPYIATKDVGYGYDKINYENGVKIPVDELKFRIARKDTVLICAEGGSAGKKCGLTNRDICFGNKLYAIEQHGNILSAYLLAVVQTNSFFSEFSKRMTGIIGGISINKFGEIPIPLPPLEEQKAIVAVVEQLLTEVEQLEQFALAALRDLAANDTPREWEALQPRFHTFFNETANIKKLRETILQLAVQGKLTARWRKANSPFEGGNGNPDDHDAALLLQKIKTEKARLIAQGKIKKENPLPEIAEDEKPYELPEGWVWCRLGEVIDLVMGQSPDGNSYNDIGNGIPLINGPVEFGPGAFDKTLKTKFTTSPTKLCKKGDLLVCVRGATTGRTNIAGFDACIGRGVAALSPYFNKEYLKYFMLKSRYEMLDKGTGTTFPSISREDILKFTFPLPTNAEQQAIVSTVNRLMALCDALEQETTQSKAQAELWMKGVVREVLEKEY